MGPIAALISGGGDALVWTVSAFATVGALPAIIPFYRWMRARSSADKHEFEDPEASASKHAAPAAGEVAMGTA